MEKSEAVFSPKPRATRVKSAGAKRRGRAPRTKAGPPPNPAEVAKMIDRIWEEVELHHGRASEPEDKLEKLLIIKKLLEDSLPGAAGKKQPAAVPAAPNGVKKILVVDDDPTTVKIITHFLHREDFRVSTADSGVDGLKKAFEEGPDLILLDVMMPDLNGFQFLSIYRQDEANLRTPVVILSSLSEEANLLKGLETGAVDYITKPFSPQVLMAKIKKNINPRA